MGLDEFVRSGTVVDLAVLVLIAETAALVALRRRRPSGPPVAGLLWNAAAGAALMLAVRAAVTGADSLVVLVWLAVAGVVHAGDQVTRWRRG